MLAAIVLSLIAWALGSAQAQTWEMRICSDPFNFPFSSEIEAGFENRIAAILAEELDATLTVVWWYQGERMTQKLRQGECDVIMGVQDGQALMLSTLSYYRSPFVFVYRADSGFEINSFDDPILRELRLGVQPAGGPTHQALMARNLSDNIALLLNNRGLDAQEPLARLTEAVAESVIDVAVSWGPAAGYFAELQSVDLKVSPAAFVFEPPFVPLFINMAMGVRLGDESLRDLLDIAIAERWDEIQEVLLEYRVPMMPLPKPIATLGAP